MPDGADILGSVLLFPSLLTPPAVRRGTAALAVAAAGFALGGCTTQPSGQTETLKGEAGKVQAAAENFRAHAVDDDAKGICATDLTASAAAALAKGTDCATAVQRILDRTDLTTFDVSTVRVEGATAVATITLVKKARDDTRFVLKQTAKGQPWKIAAFGNAAAAEAFPAATGTSPESTSPTASTPAE